MKKATEIVERHDRIIALESKIMGAKVAKVRAHGMVLNMLAIGCHHAASCYTSARVEAERRIHALSTELDTLRGWSI